MSGLFFVFAVAACGGVTVDPVDSDFQLSPANVDVAQRITDLNTQEATDWCNWFVYTAWPEYSAISSDSASDPADVVPLTYEAPEGVYVFNFTTLGCFGPYWGCLGRPPVAVCAANLRVGHCEATLDELDACLREYWLLHIHHQCSGEPEPGPACQTYRSKPGCDGTIIAGDLSVLPTPPPPHFQYQNGCALRVE